jgi:hypothetical protein
MLQIIKLYFPLSIGKQEKKMLHENQTEMTALHTMVEQVGAVSKQNLRQLLFMWCIQLH